MAEITAAAVKALRERTDLPMMDCKKALVEADGDEERAVEILKEQVGKVMDKRKDNATAEGKFVVLIADDGSGDVIARIAEVAGGRARGHLGAARDLAGAEVQETDLLEHPLGDITSPGAAGGLPEALAGHDPRPLSGAELRLGPFQLTTLRIRRTAGSSMTKE